MGLYDLLNELAVRGVELRAAPEGDGILFRPRLALDDALVRALSAHKTELMPLVAQTSSPAVAWRVMVMRAQMPARGPIPLLLARPQAPLLRDAPGRCGSCGDPREEGQRYVCRACQAAKWLVLNAVREDVSLARTTETAPAPMTRQEESA